MEIHSSTAAWAPSMAAAATSGPRPVSRPHRMDTVTIPVQINAIAISLAPFPFRVIFISVSHFDTHLCNFIPFQSFCVFSLDLHFFLVFY